MDQQHGARGITEAVGGLEQAMSGIAQILQGHGEMLAHLLALATQRPAEETELEKLIQQLVTRLDQQNATLSRIETEMGAFNAVVAKAG